MPNLTNYYEELKISKELSTTDIHVELTKLKRVWIQREINQPEKARKILTVIDQAYEVFKTEATRSKYDQALANSTKEVGVQDTTEEKRKETAKKWFTQGLNHSINHQFDLAAEAFDQALLYCQQDDDNYCAIHDRAAIAYKGIKNYKRAIDCINKAIVVNPQNLDYYRTKEGIYFSIKFEQIDNLEHGRHVDLDALNSAVQHQRELLKYILTQAEKTDSYKDITYALDQLASTWYWDDPKDQILALQYVNKYIAKLKDVNEEYWESVFEDTQSYFILKDKEQRNDETKSGSDDIVRASNSYSYGSGCYIATAVYGSYDCPQVWVLRRYRDGYLAKNWIGRRFIDAYYAVSPAVVRRFGDSSKFNTFWRHILDRMILHLREIGVNNKPYDDK